MTKDYYQILGVLDDAEDVVIRAAYKALAQRYHPDKWTGDKEEANHRMQEINEAYAILSDDDKRKKYDATREKAEYSDAQSEYFEDLYQDVNTDWEIAQKIYPDLIEIERGLIKLSSFLGFTFRLLLLESKRFSHRHVVASEIERTYLSKYFGENRELQIFAKELIFEGKRDAAKELNDYIRVIGSQLNALQIIEKLSKKYQTRRYLYEQEVDKYKLNIFLGAIAFMFIGFISLQFLSTSNNKKTEVPPVKASSQFVPYTGIIVPNDFNLDISGNYSQVNGGLVTAKISTGKIQLITANPSGCTGEVEGKLNEYVKGKYQLLVSGEKCLIDLYRYSYSGKDAIRVDEKDCWSYHGMNCNFSGILIKE